MENKTTTVSELIQGIKVVLESKFQNIAVVGEISNLSSSAAGHFYFTLSDQSSSVSCAIFKMDAMRNPLIRKVKNGDKIIIVGPINVYNKKGTFQVIAKRILPAGRGDLAYQFELLKAKLTKEGLFDISLKKPIPQFPKRIGVVTALKGAALQDFLNIMKRRTLWCDIVIIPAVVQGGASAQSLIEAIYKAEGIGNLDVLVLTRGGGSIEDLWSFNDEQLVRTIFDCDIPVISAVGHQVDFSLCDFVSDFRCETPSAAAEILSQPHTEIRQRINMVGHKLRHHLFTTHSNIEKRLSKLNPINVLHIIKENLSKQKERFERLRFVERSNEFLGLYDSQMTLDDLINRAQRAIKDQLAKDKHRIELCHNSLNGLNPMNVLHRGYSIVKDDQNRVVTNLKTFNTLEDNTSLNIQFSDGVGKVKK